MGEALLHWFASLAASGAGVRIAWSWAFLEAILLPLPPEILLIPLALARPQSALSLAFSAVTGSILGGMVSYAAGRRFRQGAIGVLKRLPGVDADHVLWASSHLRRSGIVFIALSPWLLLPYKVTSVLSGERAISWWLYLLGGMIGRGTRLITITMVAAACATVGESLVRAYPIPALALVYVAAGGIIWTVRRALIENLER